MKSGWRRGLHLRAPIIAGDHQASFRCVSPIEPPIKRYETFLKRGCLDMEGPRVSGASMTRQMCSVSPNSLYYTIRPLRIRIRNISRLRFASTLVSVDSSEERRGGKSGSLRVDLGGCRLKKKKT